jgi:hypothetical protein
MDNDNKNKNLEKNISGKSITTIFNDCAIPESIWIRRYSVWTNVVDRKFMEGQCYFVLRCGVIFWSLYILEKIV